MREFKGTGELGQVGAEEEKGKVEGWGAGDEGRKG